MRQRQPPPTLAHFAHVNRYWDRVHRTSAAKLLPGEYYVSSAGEMLVTVLGSCVSACVRDVRLGVGGMNHFMLPLDVSRGNSARGRAVSAATRYGNVAMERLINDILKLGGRRESLEFKLVGGGKVLPAVSMDIGLRNISFVRRYVAEEGFTVAGEDLGDIYPRKVCYFPESGRLRVKKLTSLHNDTLIERERHYMDDLEHDPVSSEIELF